MSTADVPVFRFEDIEVDPLRGQVKYHQEERHLRQKAFGVLVYLIENRERVVPKNELIEKLWNGTAVVDDALVQCIKDIRRTLGDDPHQPRFIRTIPKIGYRFISQVSEELLETTTTQFEEITRVELEIEEESLLVSLKRLFILTKLRFAVSFAAIVLVAIAAVLIYLPAQIFSSFNAAGVSAQAITDNRDAMRFYSLGVEKAQAVQNKEAIEYFEKALELDPEFAMAHARIGYVYALMWGQHEKGRPFLDRALNFTHRLSEKDKLQITAWSAIAEQDYQAAIPHLREIITRFPDDTEAYWRLGRVLMGEGQHDEAVAVLRQGLVVDPAAKNIYNFLGGLTSMLGRHDEAIDLQQRYVELAPGEPNAYDSLGLALQHSGRYREAITQYQRALDLKPDFEVAMAHFANARFQQGRYREALALYRKYVEIAPTDAEKGRGHGRIAIIYGRLNKFKEAEIEAGHAAKYNDDEFAGLLLALERDDYAAIGSREGQLFRKPRYSSRGVRNDSRIKAHLRGMIALSKKQDDEALENFRQIADYLPPTWDLIDLEDSLAKAYLKTGHVERSLAEFERLLLLNPNYPLAHFHIAQAREQMGQYDLSREHYLRFLEIWRDADVDIPEVVIARKRVG
jgi:tetratricopeptide (TPR) repeat protein